jgi:hypothetical protein
MSVNPLFPEWIMESFTKGGAALNERSKELFAKTVELSSHFDQSYLSIPAQSELGVLKSTKPEDIHKQYGIDSPREFILLNLLESFHYHAVYQIRELALSLIDALSQGRFFVAAIINRSMLEVVAINYYTFRRLESHSAECLDILRSAVRTRSNKEKATQSEKYGKKTFEIITLLLDSNAATSIDWKEYLQKFDVAIETQEISKKLNVLTAIQDLQKASKLPLEDSYKIMCEFVHPNAGSKMLIVNTRTNHDESMYRLTIGDNKGNSEAALFYVDHMAEAMYYTITLAMSLFTRSQDLAEKFAKPVDRKSSETHH